MPVPDEEEVSSGIRRDLALALQNLAGVPDAGTEEHQPERLDPPAKRISRTSANIKAMLSAKTAQVRFSLCNRVSWGRPKKVPSWMPLSSSTLFEAPSDLANSPTPWKMFETR